MIKICVLVKFYLLFRCGSDQFGLGLEMAEVLEYAKDIQYILLQRQTLIKLGL